MLPRLLAPYRKYGSCPAGWPLAANHFCSRGAVDETTRKGRPTHQASRAISQNTGVPSVGGVQPGPIAIGRVSAATVRNARWSATCRRRQSQRLIRCA